MTILPPPEREAFEREIHVLIEQERDQSAIARLLQKDQSAVSNAFNPYREDRLNPIHQFVLYLWAFDVIRPGLANTVLEIVARERCKWLVSDAPVRAQCPAKLTGKVGAEYAQAIETEIAGHDIDDQIREWGDVIKAAAEKQKALIAKRAQSFVTVGNGNIRDFGKVVVGAKKDNGAGK